MDRREFLSTSGMAAAATATTVTGVSAAEAAVATRSGAIAPTMSAAVSANRSIVVSVARSIETLEIGTAARRFAHRLEAALGEGTTVTVVSSGSSGIETVTSADADLAIGLESHNASYHPAFRLLAGLPIGEHLSPAAQYAWLTAGGGQELWDELAGGFDVKALAVGHTGVSAGLYAERIFETANDVRGLRIACRGLARDVVTALGGVAVGIDEQELTGGLTALGLDAAEPLGVPTPAVAHWSYQPGLMPGGMMLSLNMRASFWAKLGRSGQAVLEGAAGEAFGHATAMAMANHAALRRVERMRRWPIVTAAPPALVTALAVAGTDAVDQAKDQDRLAGRLVDSLRRFRHGIDDEGDRLGTLVV